MPYLQLVLRCQGNYYIKYMSLTRARDEQFKLNNAMAGQHSGIAVSTVSSQQECPGFDPQADQRRPSVWSLHVFPKPV